MLNLINRLPRGSQLSRARHGEDVEWSLTDHLLAIVADRIAHLEWAFLCTRIDPEKGSIPDPPTPITRPGVEQSTPEQPTSMDIARFFAT